VIVDYYPNHRIDVNAVQADGRWNAEVRTLRLFSQDKPDVEIRHQLQADLAACGDERRHLCAALDRPKVDVTL
jgi:hypothetical protein